MVWFLTLQLKILAQRKEFVLNEHFQRPTLYLPCGHHVTATTASLKKEIDFMFEFVAFLYAKWFLRSSISAISPRLVFKPIWIIKNYEGWR